MRVRIAGYLSAVRAPGRSSAMPDEHRERGSINVLTLGYLVIALLAATVLMAASSVHLEYQRLLSVTDGAAAAAADSFDVADIRGSDKGRASAHLDDSRVRSAVSEYLTHSPESGRLDRLRILEASGSQDGRSSRVTLQAVAHPPVVSLFLPDGVVLESQSTARAVLVR
ncbi:hypothetical protein [Arthrobacter sp. NPDC090010]|uniref:hypothetical protein n=1 Tax=Arthrobacter sp. NPDC090010 TaxID=3363942 RepID=UPI0037F74B3B